MASLTEKVCSSTVMEVFIVGNSYKGFGVAKALIFCLPERCLRGHGTMAPFHGRMEHAMWFLLMGTRKRLEVVAGKIYREAMSMYIHVSIICILV